MTFSIAPDLRLFHLRETPRREKAQNLRGAYFRSIPPRIAASRDLKASPPGVGHAVRRCSPPLYESVTDDTALDIFALTSSQRAIVDPEGYCDGWRINGLRFDCRINCQRKSVSDTEALPMLQVKQCRLQMLRRYPPALIREMPEFG